MFYSILIALFLGLSSPAQHQHADNKGGTGVITHSGGEGGHVPPHLPLPGGPVCGH